MYGTPAHGFLSGAYPLPRQINVLTYPLIGDIIIIKQVNDKSEFTGAIVLDKEKKSLLKSKLENLKIKQSQQHQDNERKRIIENVDDFYEKYRFADGSESIKIEEFIENFT